VCAQNSGCIQIRDDIVNYSQLLTTLAGARAADNPSECIYMVHDIATAETLQVICAWVAQHIEFERRDEADALRLAFDQRFLLLNAAGLAAYDDAVNDQARAEILDSRTDWLRWRPDDAMFQRRGPVEPRLHRDHEQIRSMLFLSHLIELQPLEWHVRFQAEENTRMALQTSGVHQEVQAYFGYAISSSNFAEDIQMLCCHILGDMILSCESDYECQLRFPDYVDDQMQVATKERYGTAHSPRYILCTTHAGQVCAFCMSVLVGVSVLHRRRPSLFASGAAGGLLFHRQRCDQIAHF
jgi:hypothetical protein